MTRGSSLRGLAQNDTGILRCAQNDRGGMTASVLTQVRMSDLKLFRWWPPQAVLLVTFAALYFAIGPGNFFAVDEVAVEETAQALILRRNLDIPLMTDARQGRA